MVVAPAMIAGLLVAAPRAAEAQEAPPFDPAVDVQLFDYAIGQKAFFTVADSDTMGKKQFSLDFLVTFFTNPFVIYNFNNEDGEITEERSTVV